jgi:pimeloyl-ACP methyl ester carboxylesterase
MMRRSWFSALTASSLAASLVLPGFALADDPALLFNVKDLVAGKTIDKSDCEALPHHAWIEAVAGGPSCLRYFPSDVVGNADRALIVLFPDMLNLQAPGGRPAPYGSYRFSPKSLSNQASALAARYGGPVVALARPGTFGSSGYERTDRHTFREVGLINSAIDQIKTDLHLTGIDIVGQSAGGSLAVAMAEQRTDVRCAVASSGALSSVEAQVAVGFKPNAAYLARTYDPLQFVDKLMNKPALRLIAVSDLDDKAVVQSSTLHFLAELARRKTPYLHIHAEASDADHHDLTAAGQRAAIVCAHGEPDDTIVDRVGSRAP